MNMDKKTEGTLKGFVKKASQVTLTKKNECDRNKNEITLNVKDWKEYSDKREREISDFDFPDE